MHIITHKKSMFHIVGKLYVINTYGILCWSKYVSLNVSVINRLINTVSQYKHLPSAI